MNIKMTINSQLLTTKSKKQKSSKQLEQEYNHRYGDMQRVSAGRGKEESGVKGAGIKKHNWQVQNRGMLRIVQEMEKPENIYA